MTRTSNGGLELMRELARGLPEQLADGFEAGRLVGAPSRRGIRAVTVVGMGGSGIAPHLLAPVLATETELSVSLSDGLTSPFRWDPKTLTVFVSYSGGTWETLSAYLEAGRSSAPRIVIASGGELARRARRDGVPFVALPPGIPPRSAVGFQLGALLGLVDPWFDRPNAPRIQRVARKIRYRQALWSRPDGLPSRLAERVGPRMPTIYADSGIGGVARRWKTQVDENAKRLASYDVLPEVLHNAIVSWDAVRAPIARRNSVIFLNWAGEDPRVHEASEYLARLLERRRVAVSSVDIDGADRLEAIVGGVSIGDHFSLFLAQNAGVDPLPYDAITRMKETLERRWAREGPK
ncbi:MAG: SIS domain-containing protein [Thermoplasmata archaeon]|jgi:glucose/mannose-6-phosphate isomerase